MGRTRNSSPPPPLRIPHHTIPIDRVLEANEMRDFVERYTKKLGLTWNEFQNLGKFNKKTHYNSTIIYIKPENNLHNRSQLQRFPTIEKMVYWFVREVEQGERTGDITYVNFVNAIPLNNYNLPKNYGSSSKYQNGTPIDSLPLTRQTLLDIPSYRAYVDTLARKNGLDELKFDQLFLTNDNMERILDGKEIKFD